MTGRFIVFDGPSGVGKTTLVAAVAALLATAGLPIATTREPTDSPLGQLARGSTHDLGPHALACLVAADRYQHLDTFVRPRVRDGMTVISDRYLPSSLALQSIDGVALDYIVYLNKHVDRPDVTIALDADPATALHRSQSRGQYSRLHPQRLDASKREQRAYGAAFTLLIDAGWNVRHVRRRPC